MSKASQQRARIGAVAVEDEGIFFAVAAADADGLTGWEISPQLWPWSGDRKSGVRYSRPIIEGMIRRWFNNEIGETTKLSAIGVSMFGLVRLGDGTLRGVPRSDWADLSDTALNFETLFQRERWGDIPLVVAHDATTAALGEYQEFRFKHRETPVGFAHVRVGTGVGVGMLGGVGSTYGVPFFGRVNVEAGHIAVVPHENDRFESFTCIQHQQYPCLEGRISEKALLLRCNVDSVKEIPDKDRVWEIVADYLSQLCVVITNIIGPDVIVLGGRTMFGNDNKPRSKLFRRVREIFKDRVNGYPHHELMTDLKGYIRPALIAQGYASVSGVAEIARQRVF